MPNGPTAQTAPSPMRWVCRASIFAAISPGRHRLIPTLGELPYRNVLFIGVRSLADFGYTEIRRFSKSALAILAREDCDKGTLGMTMQGVGYGLDEKEAFSAQVAGLMEYLQSPDTAWRPNRIKIVERDASRAERLGHVLATIRAAADAERPGDVLGSARILPDAGIKSDSKNHVFVAMPYDEEMEDVYEFGICEPVNSAGCLCERCDYSVFTGDVLDRIRIGQPNADLVLAEAARGPPRKAGSSRRVQKALARVPGLPTWRGVMGCLGRDDARSACCRTGTPARLHRRVRHGCGARQRATASAGCV